MISFLFPYANEGVLFLRVIFGVLFFVHGWKKLSNLRGTQSWFHSIGFRPGVFWGTLVALVETAGGLLMTAGLLTQVAALFLAVIMITAASWKIKKGDAFIGGYELDLILLGVTIAFAANGGGGYALDAYYQLVLY